MSTKVYSCLLALALACGVSAHSWIACSDYAEKNGADWDPAKCRGFPRDGHRYAQKDSFGLDRGFDYKPGATQPGCRTPYTSGSYPADYPKAIYYPGQQVILAHPMKNHGADEGCTNKYIPDNGNAIYRGEKNTDRDQTFAYYKKELVADLGVSPFGHNAVVSQYPKQGYQNAPHFCKDTDKSMGTYSFNVPNLEPGEYTFMWRWSFNGPQDVYTTCFDVQIANDFDHRNQLLQARGMNNFYVACGGSISNGQAGSLVGCNGVTPAPTQPPQTPRVTTARPAPTTQRVTAAPTQGPDGSENKPMNVMQMTGEVSLGFPRNGISRRYVMVHFDCAVQASFWNARVIRADSNGHYELLQENPIHVGSGKVFFTANFDGACPLAFVPHAKLMRDE